MRISLSAPSFCYGSISSLISLEVSEMNREAVEASVSVLSDSLAEECDVSIQFIEENGEERFVIIVTERKI